MPEGTNPNQTDGTKQPEPVGANPPQGGSETTAAVQSNGAGSQESQSPTPEQIENWRKMAEQYQSLEPEYRRVTQHNARISEEADRFRQIAEAAVGRQSPAADPEALADAEFADAIASFDQQRIMAAARKRDDVKLNRLRSQLVPELLNVVRVQEGMKAASEWGYGDPNKLREVSQTLTPEELAKIAAMREGKFDAIAEERKKRAKEEAERASLLGSAMTGRANGMPARQDPKDPHPNPTIFFAWNPRRREEHVKKHGVPPYAKRAE